MFYSHTFLARKGPLGTVWWAAHLQNKLRKSHYTSTDIFSTVERIMHPEVPIALRMSGHLLLGIARIYSKQVEYLYEDYNEALKLIRKACTTLKAKGADTDNDSAKIRSLDEVVLDDNSHRIEDDHVKDPEDITLPDQFPSVTGIQNVVTTDMEDARDASSVPEVVSESGPMPMEQDPTPLVPEGVTGNIGDHSNNNQAEQNGLPEREILRDAVQYTPQRYNSLFEDIRDVRMEPDGSLEEQARKDREASPILKEVHVSGDSSKLNDRPEIPALEDSALPSLPGLGSPDLDILSTPQVRESPELRLRHTSPDCESESRVPQPAPPVDQQGVRVRKRRRQFYDEATCLTNRVMKDSLDDTSNLLRTKRIRHIANLGVWKQQNRLKKDAVFYEPVITGLSADLRTIHNPQFIYSRNKLVSSKEAQHEAGVAECPASEANNDMEMEHQHNFEGSTLREAQHEADAAECPASEANNVMEIEYLRNFEGPTLDYRMSVLLPSPQQSRSHSCMTMPSSSRRDEYTPASMNMTFTSQSDHLGETRRTEIVSSPEMSASTAFKYFDAETSIREGRGGQNTPLSGIPETGNSSGNLDFLEHDDNLLSGTPASVRVGEKEVPQFDTLSATTRAVGQYFKRQSLETPSSDYSSESVSLDSILDGKTRKISARMFYETLVLKSYGFVDVKQEKPYSPIELKVTSKLKEQCSA